MLDVHAYRFKSQENAWHDSHTVLKSQEALEISTQIRQNTSRPNSSIQPQQAIE